MGLLDNPCLKFGYTADFSTRICYGTPVYNFFDTTLYACGAPQSSIKIINNQIIAFYGIYDGNSIQISSSGMSYSPISGDSIQVNVYNIKPFQGGDFSAAFLDLRKYNGSTTYTSTYQIQNGQIALFSGSTNCSGWKTFQNFTCVFGSYYGVNERCEGSF